MGAVAATTFGAMPIPLARVLSALVAPLGIAFGDGHSAIEASVLWNLRIPRLALATFGGAALALAGAGLQGIFRNPLADPGLIGATSGAALGAVLTIATGAAVLPAIAGISGATTVAAGAFVGALTATGVVYVLATRNGRTSVVTMLLTGVAINALGGAVLGAITYTSTDSQLRNITLWTLGSLGGATWNSVALSGLTLTVGAFVIWRAADSLDLLQLGESEAFHVGVEVDALKRRVVWSSALLVAGIVAFAGLIGFVGLVVPHLVRLLVGPSHRLLVAAAAILGAALLVWADVIARTIVAPSEMPIGVITAILGAPFFLVLVQSHGMARGGSNA